MAMRGTGQLAVGLLAACLAPAASGQVSGAYTSGPSAGTTDGPNLLFFGNSFTISAANPLVSNPSYGGARGVPELVRQVAIAAGHEAPFVKNVFHQGRGYDYHIDPLQASLAEIDEPKLDGESWDYTVLQGYSMRGTDHPYTGNAAKLKHNGWLLYDEVRVGTTNHSLQSPFVVPVFFQTWARHPDHWVYDTSSPHTAGANIPLGPSSWKGPPLFDGAADMASQVRTGYEQLREYVVSSLPTAQPRVAPVGDAWEAAGWGTLGVGLYSSDRYHAASGGDLLTALTIYGTIWDDPDTSALVASGQLDATLAAIGVSPADAALLAQAADAVLRDPPTAAAPEVPPRAILIDFSQAVGWVAGPEQLPHAGRYYNLISDFTAGAVVDAVDTTGQATPVDVHILDGFADETAGGAAGAWIGAKGLGCSLFDERAQMDGFFVGRGAGYTDERAVLEVRDLDFHWSWTFTFHGSRSDGSLGRLGSYRIGPNTRTLDALQNLNLTARIESVVPGPSGHVLIEITNGGIDQNFGYLGVLQIERTCPTPEPYCVASTTSIPGCQAAIAGLGTPSYANPTGFTISSGAVPGSNIGICFFGNHGRASIPFGTLGGQICVQGPVFRSTPRLSGGTKGNCDGVFNFTLQDLIDQSPIVFAGAILNAEIWARDPTNADGYLLSDGLEFTVCP